MRVNLDDQLDYDQVLRRASAARGCLFGLLFSLGALGIAGGIVWAVWQWTL